MHHTQSLRQHTHTHLRTPPTHTHTHTHTCTCTHSHACTLMPTVTRVHAYMHGHAHASALPTTESLWPTKHILYISNTVELAMELKRSCSEDTTPLLDKLFFKPYSSGSDLNKHGPKTAPLSRQFLCQVLGWSFIRALVVLCALDWGPVEPVERSCSEETTPL